MLREFASFETLADIVDRALVDQSARCLDDAEERVCVREAVLTALSQSSDARFVRTLLGRDPADRMTRMHAHGALLGRAAEAAWRLAAGWMYVDDEASAGPTEES